MQSVVYLFNYVCQGYCLMPRYHTICVMVLFCKINLSAPLQIVEWFQIFIWSFVLIVFVRCFCLPSCMHDMHLWESLFYIALLLRWTWVFCKLFFIKIPVLVFEIVDFAFICSLMNILSLLSLLVLT